MPKAMLTCLTRLDSDDQDGSRQNDGCSIRPRGIRRRNAHANTLQPILFHFSIARPTFTSADQQIFSEPAKPSMRRLEVTAFWAETASKTPLSNQSTAPHSTPRAKSNRVRRQSGLCDSRTILEGREKARNSTKNEEHKKERGTQERASNAEMSEELKHNGKDKIRTIIFRRTSAVFTTSISMQISYNLLPFRRKTVAHLCRPASF